MGGGYPPNNDPAYAGYWGPTQQGYPGAGYPPSNNPTEQLPAYWQPGSNPYQQPTEPPPPGGPKSPKWLWIAAGVALVLAVGLIAALIIVTGSSKESTIVAPLPPISQSSSTLPTSTTSTRTSTTTAPMPTPVPTTTATPTTPSATTSPAGTDTVVYSVQGEGRAINITYVDTGGIMQTEFNVLLPWTKQVSLTSPARGSASVAVVNVGRDVTCSVSVNGLQFRQRTGRGLTICTGAG
jgi:hypothetical protein